MSKLKDVLRLKFEVGLSHQRIAVAVDLSRGVRPSALCSRRLQDLPYLRRAIDAPGCTLVHHRRRIQ